MAITVSDLTSATSIISSASLTISNITANIGDYLFIAVAADNAGSNGVASLSDSISDSVGNVYTLQRKINRTAGVVLDGVTLGIWLTRIEIPTSNATITIPFSPNTVSKAAIVKKLVCLSQERINVREAGTGATGSSTAQTISAVSMTSGDTIIGVLGVEQTTQPTADSDTTNGIWSAQQSASASTGTNGTSITIAAQNKTVSNSGTQTYNTSTSVSGAWAMNYITLYTTLTGWVGCWSLNRIG